MAKPTQAPVGVKIVFDFKDYKEYLRYILDARDAGSRGARSALATAAQCQIAYVSQVLNGNANFSPEQADLINEFLAHGSEEADYFMLLVMKGRAGSVRLEKYYQKHIERTLERRNNLTQKLADRVLSSEAQMVYYSQWYHSAIHVMLSIPGFNTKEKIARYLKLELKTVVDALDYLTSVGLVVREGERYILGKTKVFLKKGTPMFAVNHANWRQQAIRAIDQARMEDQHFTAVVSLSKDDAQKLQKMMSEFIDQAVAVVLPSKEEELHCMCFDFFKMA